MVAVNFDEEGLKKCTICGIKKKKEEYYSCPSYKCGFRPNCIDCCKEDANKFHKKSPKDPKKNREDKLKRHYGITLEDYDRMFFEQKGVCAICGLPQVVQNRKDGRVVSNLFIDHCHNEGNVRGLLCSECNTGLGKFKDNIEILLKAAIYLENSRQK